MKQPILVAALGALCAVAGCNLLLQNTGNEVVDSSVEASADAPTEASVQGSTVACGIPAGTSQCQACLQGACCAAATACAGNPGCAAYEGCLVPCGADYACRAQCIIDHGASSPEVAAMDACLVQSCQSACGVSCGITGADTSPGAADTCQRCVIASDSACAAGQACGLSLSCQRVADCTTACTTPDCQQACADGEDAGAALSQSFLKALGGCSSACTYDQHWDCVGKVGRPLPKGPETQLTVVVAQWASAPPLPPIAGAQVLACESFDPTCASPAARGTTDASGQVVLTILQGATGFAGHLEVSASEYVPELYFLAYGLSELRSTIDVTLTTSQVEGDFFNALTPDGGALDPTRGLVTVSATDCYLLGAAGVTIQADGIDAQTRLVYLSGGIPSTTATATDVSGVAVLVNAPATTISLTATPQAIGRPSSKASVLVRPGAISYVNLLPNQ